MPGMARKRRGEKRKRLAAQKAKKPAKNSFAGAAGALRKWLNVLYAIASRENSMALSGLWRQPEANEEASAIDNRQWLIESSVISRNQYQCMAAGYQLKAAAMAGGWRNMASGSSMTTIEISVIPAKLAAENRRNAETVSGVILWLAYRRYVAASQLSLASGIRLTWLVGG
jgi:hypothetical protein